MLYSSWKRYWHIIETCYVYLGNVIYSTSKLGIGTKSNNEVTLKSLKQYYHQVV